MDRVHGAPFFYLFFFLFHFLFSVFFYLSFLLFFLLKKYRKLEEKRNKIKAHKAKSHGPLVCSFLVSYFILFSFFLTKKNRKNKK